jgi:hypothetical protein
LAIPPVGATVMMTLGLLMSVSDSLN